MSFDKTKLPDVGDYYASQGLTIGKHGSRGWRKANCLFCQSRDNFNINLQSGGFHCWGCDAKGGDLVAFQMALHGQDFKQAAQSLGAWTNDGKAPIRNKPMPLSYRDILSAIAHEAQLIAISGANVANGKPLSVEELARVLQAVSRINRMLEACQ